MLVFKNQAIDIKFQERVLKHIFSIPLLYIKLTSFHSDIFLNSNITCRPWKFKERLVPRMSAKGPKTIKFITIILNNFCDNLSTYSLTTDT